MRLPRLIRDESGQTTILAASCMVVLLAFVGLAVDVGHLRYVKRSLQTAVDAAALSAALELNACGSTADCTVMQTAAQKAMSENGYTGLTVTATCTPPSGSATVLIVNNAPCMLGSADPKNGNQNYVEVVFAQPQTTYFARVVGFNNVPVMVRAEATRSQPACIYALDTTGAGAISVDALAAVYSSCPIEDESSSTAALSCNLLASINAPLIKVVGSTQQLLCSVAATPQTNTHIPIPADPLAYLAKPTVPACGVSITSPYHGSATTVTIAGNATLYADAAYCGGINILPTANVVFKPGTYVLTSHLSSLLPFSGGLSVDLGATVSGTGVTFYNLGPSGGVVFGLSSITLGTISLTAPTSGTYAGMLFFQDSTNTNAATFIGATSLNTTLVGAYYFPSTTVNYAVSGSNSYNILVAKDIHFSTITLLGLPYGQSIFGNNYSSQSSGSSPIPSNGSVLSQ